MNVPATHDAGPSQSTRLAYVDGMRGLAMAYVVMHHIFLQRITDGWQFLYFGRFAVVFFIVISGFCLTLETMRNGEESYGHFLAKRATRILPSYYAGMLFSVLLMMLFLSDGHVLPQGTGKALLYLATFSQNGTGYGDTINGTYWFFPLLLQAYALFPLLFRFLKRVHLMLFVACAFLAAPLVTLWTNVHVPGAQWHFTALFALGMAAAYAGAGVKTKDARTIFAAQLSAAAAFAFFVLMFRVTPDPLNQNKFFMDLLSAGACSAILGMLMLGTGPVRQALEWKPLQVLGTLSFALYLVHDRIIDVVDTFVVTPMQDIVSPIAYLAVVSIPLSLGAAWVLHEFIEKPAARYFHGHGTSKKEPESQTVIGGLAKA